LADITPGRYAFTFDELVMRSRLSNLSSSLAPDLSSELAPGVKMALPLIPSPMSNVITPALLQHFVDLGGVAIGHRWMSEAEQLELIRRFPDRFVAVVGLRGKDTSPDPAHINENPEFIRARRFLDAGALGILIDVNISWTEYYLAFTSALAKANPRVLIVGNIDQPEAVIDLFNAGATTVKVGIGPGSHCSTRAMTPIGFPQAHAVAECAWIAQQLGMRVIADGGIGLNPRKAAMAFALGADVVMTGKKFAATDEGAAKKTFLPLDWLLGKFCRGLSHLTSSSWVENNARSTGHFALYHGMAEASFQRLTSGKDRPGQGYKGRVARTGPAKILLTTTMNEWKVAVASVGAKDIRELRLRASFSQVGPEYTKESGQRTS
jgi:IMP dehydrogenase